MKKRLEKILILNLTMLIIISTVSSAINTNVVESKDYKPYVYKLLIIAPKEYYNALQPLVNHKNNIGISTKLVALDEVYNRMYWYGRDNPEKIKYFIKTAVEQWGIKYVMLVGDYKKIPVRYVYNADNNTFFPEPRFISELYYADIYDKNNNFSTWDTNGNGRYGEWFGEEAEDKNIDLYPDVYVGRLACRNIMEVKTMVNKIITYETKTSNSQWFHRFVVIAGDTYPETLNPKWVGYEGEENTVKAIQNMTDFEVIKLWTSDGTLTGRKDVIKALNFGCGFVYFDGHGSPMSWATHPPNDADTWVRGLETYSMWRLHNGYKLPVCIVGGCHNSEFDVTPLNLLDHPKESLNLRFDFIPECWSWKLVSKPFGGAIAAIGCTGLGMTKEDKESFEGASDYLEPRFFYQYGANHTDVLGDTWGKAITDYLHKYPINWSTPAAGDYAIDAKTVQQWALLGDPSLRIGGYQQAQ